MFPEPRNLVKSEAIPGSWGWLFSPSLSFLLCKLSEPIVSPSLIRKFSDHSILACASYLGVPLI